MTTDTYLLENDLDQNEDFWEKNRKTELTGEDSRIYVMVDSVKRVPFFRTINTVVTMLSNYYLVMGPVEFGPYYTTFSSNVIEGPRLRLGGRSSNSFSTKIMPEDISHMALMTNVLAWPVCHLYV
jgi:hypothetical protein